MVGVEGALFVADIDPLQVESLFHGSDDDFHPVGAEITEIVSEGLGEVLGGEIEVLLTLVVVPILFELF